MIFVNGSPRQLGAGQPVSVFDPDQEAKAPDKLRDHPMLAVGPWMFNPKGSRLEIADGRLSDQGQHMRFLFEGLYQVSKICRVGTQDWTHQLQCQRGSYRGWDFSGGAAETTGLSRTALRGSVPIYTVENPLEGGNWGVYITRLDHSTIVEFKKVPESWWGRLWGWIKNIVGVIIDTIRAMFDFLGVVACTLGRQYLAQVAGLAAGTAELTPNTANWLKAKAGITDNEIFELEAGARATVAETVADKIVRSACGMPGGYPSGAFAVWDPTANQYLILVPNR